MTGLWLFVTPCSTQLLCLLSSAASWLLGLTRGVECVPWQSHVLFWSCPSAVLCHTSLWLWVFCHRLCLLLWLLLQSDDMFYHFYSQWGVSPPDYSRLLYFHNCHIIKMPSAGGLRKAFSTCASHLTAITIFHAVILLLYWVPNSRSSWLFIKVVTVLFTVVIPMLNPLSTALEIMMWRRPSEN